MDRACGTCGAGGKTPAVASRQLQELDALAKGAAVIETVKQARVRGADKKFAGRVRRRCDCPYILVARDARGDVGPDAAAVLRSRERHPSPRAAHVSVIDRSGVNRSQARGSPAPCTTPMADPRAPSAVCLCARRRGPRSPSTYLCRVSSSPPQRCESIDGWFDYWGCHQSIEFRLILLGFNPHYLHPFSLRLR